MTANRFTKILVLIVMVSMLTTGVSTIPQSVIEYECEFGVIGVNESV